MKEVDYHHRLGQCGWTIFRNQCFRTNLMAPNFQLLLLFNLFSKPHIQQPAGALPDALASTSYKVPDNK